MHILKIAFSIFLLIYIFNVPCTIANVEFGYVYHSKKIARKITSFNNIKSAKFCLIKCMNNEFCRSINYNEEMKLCEIADQNEVEENLEEAQGWINIQKGKKAYRIIYKDRCVLPANGDCNINHGTKVVLKERKYCNHISALFEFDIDAGTIIHQCSRKRLCYDYLSTECVHPSLNGFAIRTWKNTIELGQYCLQQSSINARIIVGTCNLDNLDDGFTFEHLAPPKSVNVEVFKISGIRTIDQLMNHEDFQKMPNQKGYLDSVTSTVNIADWYQLRLRAYFLPPFTGPYKFSGVVNDDVKLYYESDGQTNILLNNTVASSIYNRLDLNSAVAKSDAVIMEKGKRYLLVAVMFAVGGYDFLNIGVLIPGEDTFTRIKSKYLQSTH